jgi:hypothetical protein
MATIVQEIHTKASPEQFWDAVADIGALHKRLVPGFVVAARLEPGARIVTFGNGMTLREPIITCDAKTRRLVWSAEGGVTTHYNAALQVFAGDDGGARGVWTVDFLPEMAASAITAAMVMAAGIMKLTLDMAA